MMPSETLSFIYSLHFKNTLFFSLFLFFFFFFVTILFLLQYVGDMMSRRGEFIIYWVLLVLYGCIQNAEGSEGSSTSDQQGPFMYWYYQSYSPIGHEYTFDTIPTNDECVGKLYRYW